MKLALLALPLSLALLACEPVVESGTLVISTVDLGAVDSDSVLSPGLEVEVHLYAVQAMGGAETYLGCAGPGTGLDNVTTGNARFSVNAYFLPRTGGDRTLTRADLTADNYLFVVSEDDENPCPVEQDATTHNSDPLDDQDDLIGKSALVSRMSLEAGASVSFGPVKELKVGYSSGSGM